MPFIAIAVAVSLFLGGSAVVATQTDMGAHATQSVSHTWSDIKADVESRFDSKTNVDAEASANTQIDASSSANTNVDVQANVDSNLNVII